jgi:hypothetical protein
VSSSRFLTVSASSSHLHFSFVRMSSLLCSSHSFSHATWSIVALSSSTLHQPMLCRPLDLARSTTNTCTQRSHPLSSSLSSVSLPILCDVEQETLRAECEVSSADPCPVCTLPIGRHVRRSNAQAASAATVLTSSSLSSSRLDTNPFLPHWRFDHPSHCAFP